MVYCVAAVLITTFALRFAQRSINVLKFPRYEASAESSVHGEMDLHSLAGNLFNSTTDNATAGSPTSLKHPTGTVIKMLSQDIYIIS